MREKMDGQFKSKPEAGFGIQDPPFNSTLGKKDGATAAAAAAAVAAH